MAKRKNDIPFGQDPASRLLPWIVAVMVYIAGLAIAGAFILTDFADRWETGLTGSLTIQIPPPVDEAIDPSVQDEKVKAALSAIRRTNGVASAEALATEEMRRLLEPWLGNNIDPRDLPLPSLIAVEMREGLTAASIDLRDLRRRLEAVSPGVLIDDHGQWQAELISFLGALKLVATVLVGIVTFAGLIMVVFGTRGGLLAHRQSIDLLHLFGAYDSYIARQFQMEAMKAGLKGGIFGVIATAVTVIGLGYGAASTGAVLQGAAVLNPLHWTVIALLPVATAIIAMVAARVTVMRALSRIL